MKISWRRSVFVFLILSLHDVHISCEANGDCAQDIAPQLTKSLQAANTLFPGGFQRFAIGGKTDEQQGVTDCNCLPRLAQVRPVSPQNIEQIPNNNGRITEGTDSCSRCNTSPYLQQRVFPAVNYANRIVVSETAGVAACQQCLQTPKNEELTKELILPEIPSSYDDCNKGAPGTLNESTGSCFRGSFPISRQRIFPSFNNFVNQNGPSSVLAGSAGATDCQTINTQALTPAVAIETPTNCQETPVQQSIFRNQNSLAVQSNAIESRTCQECQQRITPLARYPLLPAVEESYDSRLTLPQQTCGECGRQSVPFVVRQQQPFINFFPSSGCAQNIISPTPNIGCNTESLVFQTPSPQVDTVNLNQQQPIVNFIPSEFATPSFISPTTQSIVSDFDTAVVQAPCSKTETDAEVVIGSDCGSDSTCAEKQPLNVVVNLPEISVPIPSVVLVPEVSSVQAPRVPTFNGYPPPPIVVEGSRKSRNLRSWLPLLIVALLDDDWGYGGGIGGTGRAGCRRNCCNSCCQGNKPVPYPIPIPSCNPIVNSGRQKSCTNKC